MHEATQSPVQHSPSSSPCAHLEAWCRETQPASGCSPDSILRNQSHRMGPGLSVFLLVNNTICSVAHVLKSKHLAEGTEVTPCCEKP